MLDLKCNKCGGVLNQPGALLFSPPIGNGWTVEKYYLCVDCWLVLVAQVQPGRQPETPSANSVAAAETRPEDIQRHFAEAVNSGEIDAVLALYERGATLVVPPFGPAATGLPAIREALERVLTLKGKMVLETTYCIQAGDVALLRGKWLLTGTGPNGESVTMQGESAEVARRQPNGSWLYVIDHPLGAGSD